MKHLFVAALAIMNLAANAQDLKSLKKAFEKKNYQQAIDIANALQPAKAEDHYWIHKANYQTLLDASLQPANPQSTLKGLEAFGKMMAADKNFMKLLLADGIVDYTLVLNDYRNSFITKGSKAFDAKEYEAAAAAFSGALRATEIGNKVAGTNNLDTVLTFYTGYAYDQAKKPELAEKYYTILVDKQCKGQDLEIPYQWMANHYLNIVKDEAKGKQYLAKGLAVYPNDKYLLGLESDMYAFSENPDTYVPFFEGKIANNTATADDMINYSGKLFDAFFTSGKPKTDSVAQFAKLESIVGKTYSLKPNNVGVNYMNAVLNIQKMNTIENKIKAIKGKTPADIAAKKPLEADRLKLMDAAQKSLEFIHTVYRSKQTLQPHEKSQYKLALEYLSDFYTFKKQAEKVKEMKEKLKEIQ